MISVIVCSRSLDQFSLFASNVSNTIGVEHEVVRIDNSQNGRSICSAYNKGAEQALFHYLCFLHEDVLFQTKDWGLKLIDHFEADKEIGLIGVAGSVYKSKMSTARWQSEPGWAEIRRMNLIQHYKDAARPSNALFVNPFNEVQSPVVALDGVFLATTKETWEQNKFDEKLLKGFHGYDLDFCLQVYQSKKVVVVYDILLDHFSGGDSDGKWLAEIMKVHRKWKNHLPLYIENCQPEGRAVYYNGLKRLRKQMNLLLSEEHSFFHLFKAYNRFFSLLDNRPGYITLVKDYLKELGKLARLKYGGTKAKNRPVLEL